MCHDLTPGEVSALRLLRSTGYRAGNVLRPPDLSRPEFARVLVDLQMLAGRRLLWRIKGNYLVLRRTLAALEAWEREHAPAPQGT